MPAFDTDHLKLTDFMDLPTLQEIQDSFAAVANVKTTITDADGKLLTQQTPTSDFLKRQSAIAEAQKDGPQREGAEYVRADHREQPAIGDDPHGGGRRVGAGG